MESQESRRTVAPLAYRVGECTDSAQIAAVMAVILQEIDAVLTPIIGQGGAAALYRRCLFLTSSLHPWLTDTHKGVQTTMNLAALQVALTQQSSIAAITAGDYLLQTFYELLATLVGPSLTERLLRSVWENSSSGPPAQDTSP